MSEEMLSIGEAAKLMDVCENTLRDWDIEGKFPADRTIGNHRRYGLNQVRDYLEKNQPTSELSKLMPGNEINKLIELYEKTEFFEGVDDIRDKRALAVILDNQKCLMSIRQTEDSIFSTGQAMWLVSQSWNRCRFRHMVSIQPLLGPTGLVYLSKQTPKGFCVTDECVAAKTIKYEFNIFQNANFEIVKNLYADTMAKDLEANILDKLPSIDFEDLNGAIHATETDFSTIYDYIIAPKRIIQDISQVNVSKKIDLFEIPTYLDPKSFAPKAFAGKYPVNSLVLPVFCPYVMMTGTPIYLNGTAGLMMRVGWLTEDDIKENK